MWSRLKEETYWAKAGYELAFGQGVFEVKRQPQQITDEITVIKGKWNIGVRGQHFECMFSIKECGMVSYRYGGRELLEKIPMPNFWRAPVDNDFGNKMQVRYGSGNWPACI